MNTIPEEILKKYDATTQGYNKTTYNLYKVEDRWICNCQGFRKRGICTHTTALLAILN